MRVGSICTGYGGVEQGMRLAGWPVDLAWVADNDPGAARLLTYRHPGVPNLGDITAVDWSAVPSVDVLAAGWPCQPNSYAGAQRGSSDERHLWPYVATAIRALRPAVFVGENVPGLLTIERGGGIRRSAR